MRKWVLSFAFLLAACFNVNVLAEPYSVSETRIGTLMDDSAARAILEKYLPKTIADSRFNMARMFTLTFIQAHDEHGELTDETLKKVEVELAKLAE